MNDIFFEREMDGGDLRAYTRIDLNRASVGNRWLERTWSSFFGTTNSLLHKPGETEWVIAQNPEFLLVIDGETMNPMALGEINISEECDDLGASLVIRKANTDLDVTIVSTALHEVPALVRRVTVTNTSDRDIRVASVTSEMLEWEQKDGELVARRFFQLQTERYVCMPEDPCIGMVYDNKGMLLGTTESGEIHVNSPKHYQCNIVWPCNQSLAPLEKWTAPITYILQCDGDPLATYLKQEPEMITQLKLAERREQQIQETLQTEGMGE